MTIQDTRSYPFDLAAGATMHMPVAGAKFLIRTTSGPVDVTWRGGKLTNLIDGQGYNVRGGFVSLTLKNSGASPVVGTIQIADDAFIDTRVSGSVSLSGGITPINTAKTVANTSAQLVAANATRKYLAVQNKSPTATIWINFGAAAATTANGIKLAPGQVWETLMAVPLNAVQAIGDAVTNTDVVVVEG